jgi:hypothetical protein
MMFLRGLEVVCEYLAVLGFDEFDCKVVWFFEVKQRHHNGSFGKIAILPVLAKLFRVNITWRYAKRNITCSIVLYIN